MNNKFIKLILGGLIMALLITGCGSDEDTDREEKKSKKKDKSKTEQSKEDDEAGESDEFYFIIEAKDGAHPTQIYNPYYDMEGNVMSENNAYSAEYDDEGNLRSVANTLWKYEFDEDGNLNLITESKEDDLLFDEIGSVLKIKQIQQEKRELLESLETFYRVFFLGEQQ